MKLAYKLSEYSVENHRMWISALFLPLFMCVPSVLYQGDNGEFVYANESDINIPLRANLYFVIESLSVYFNCMMIGSNGSLDLNTVMFSDTLFPIACNNYVQL